MSSNQLVNDSVVVMSTALWSCCQVRCADGPFENIARSYFRVTERLEASSRLTQAVMDVNHWERSEWTRYRPAYGMETSSGSWTMATNECSNMGLDEFDDMVMWLWLCQRQATRYQHCHTLPRWQMMIMIRDAPIISRFADNQYRPIGISQLSCTQLVSTSFYFYYQK